MCSSNTLAPITYMNLVVDIGNSTAKIAVFDGRRMVVRKRLVADMAAEIAAMADTYAVTAAACSVVGEPHADVVRCLQSIAPHFVEVRGTTPTPLVCDYRTPETLGADRLAAAVGAATLCPGAELLIIDAGTCITYDYVGADRHYRGGNISPGLGMRLRALHDQTARLPLVEAEGEMPQTGKDTLTAIRCGVVQGMDYEIVGYVRAFRHRHPQGRVFLTGGNAYRFAQECDVERNDTLVEIGLNTILEYALD